METFLYPSAGDVGVVSTPPRGPEGFGAAVGFAENTGACAAFCSAFADVLAEHDPVCSVRLRTLSGSMTQFILRRNLRKDRTRCYRTWGMLDGI
jgi:hypothetical protein